MFFTIGLCFPRSVFSYCVFLSHRGLAPQNKPELQKVMEKRKRDQVLKAQLAEQEARKKHTDLEIELMKRQQKLEQVHMKDETYTKR